LLESNASSPLYRSTVSARFCPLPPRGEAFPSKLKDFILFPHAAFHFFSSASPRIDHFWLPGTISAPLLFFVADLGFLYSASVD